jgi:5-formyltetrahydrofolate cyclo-ligase
MDINASCKYKQELRKQMQKRRYALSAEQIARHSRLIAAKLNKLKPIINARRIMGFASIRHEVDLSCFLAGQAIQGKTILLPRVEEDGDLAAVEFGGWHLSRPGAFGIIEPTGSACSPAEIDAILVPGLVFDARGYRLGYGKGYYDRFLKLLTPNIFICGVCYDFQLVDALSPHDKDMPVHCIITEKSELIPS